MNVNFYLWGLMQPIWLLQAHLHHGEHLWQRVLSRRDGRQQAEEVVGGGVRQHLEIIW